MTTAYIQTPIGPITVLAGERIERIRFGCVPFADAKLGSTPLIAETERQINEYFAGARTRFELPLALTGTDFQLRVWQAMQKIPYGNVLSYGALATAAGSPGAARAVGGACHVNPICIVVPCHRVVAANGLGGFGGDIATKIYLLDLEKNNKKRLTESKKKL